MHASVLPLADIHCRYTEKRALFDARGGIANQARRFLEKCGEFIWLEIRNEMDMRRMDLFSEDADGFGDVVRAGIHIGPEPHRLYSHIVDHVQEHLCIFTVFSICRNRMQHYH